MDLTKLARKLRCSQTDTERVLWQRIRNRQLQGFKFRRQYPLGRYIADFVCLEAQLIIELDGGQHVETKEQDMLRSDYLERRGFTVLRFWNNQVLNDSEAVLDEISNALSNRSKPGIETKP